MSGAAPNARKRSMDLAGIVQPLRKAAKQLHESIPSKETGLSALKFALRTTRDVADASNCSPLRGAVNILLDALDRYELSDDVEADLTSIATKIENLAAIFEEYLANHREKDLIDVMESLASTVDTVRRLIEKKTSRSRTKRFWDAPNDAREVVRILRILGDVAERFVMKVNVNIDRQVQEVKEEVILQGIPFIATAQYQAIVGNDGCTQGTRLDFLDNLIDWTTAVGANVPPVCWVNGPAGMGKTTIMYTMCTALTRMGLLGGSFFCSRDSEDRRTITNIIPTLAQMLALTSPRFREALLASMQGQKGVGSYTPDTQFELLIATPARNAFGRADPPEPIRIIVIDALDECDNTDDVTCKLLQIISRKARDLRIRFLIASRPEPHLFETFKAGDSNWSTIFQLQDVPEETSKHDVLTYLTSEWARCSRESPQRSWPTDDQLQRLAWQSGGFFIYASTAWKFVSDRRSPNPGYRLREILESRFVPTDRNVDKVYNFVLEQLWTSQTDDERRLTLQCLEAIVCLDIPLTLDYLANLLDRAKENLRETLMPFQSVLRVPDADDAGLVTIYHASFAEYLLENRSHNMAWYVNPQQAHQNLYGHCWRVMRKHLCFNISNSRSSYLMNDKQPDLPQLSGELVYACRYWTNHLSRFRPSLSCIEDLLVSFRLRFLYWLEVLSVTSCVNEAQTALSTLWLCMRKLINETRGRKATTTEEQAVCGARQSNADSADDSAKVATQLEQFSEEARRFLVAYATPIAISAPHIYVSALACFDSHSLLKQAVCRHFKKVPAVITQQAQRASSLLSLRGQSGWIKCLAFSPDGKHIVSGSDNGTIRMWHADTGAQIGQSLTGHSGWINSIAISPDGKCIASGSDDGTIRLWDADIGAQLRHTLQGHFDAITSVAFSPNSPRIVSGSGDNTIRVWNTDTGAQVGQPLQGHSGWISSVVFSPDGECIVSGSEDGTIQMWSASTGEQIALPLKGHSGLITLVTFSPDGKRIASGFSHGTVQMWDGDTGMLIGQPLLGHSGSNTPVAFSPDGKLIASAMNDNTIRIWDADSGAQVGEPLAGNHDKITSILFSPDGKRVVSALDGRILRISACEWAYARTSDSQYPGYPGPSNLALGPITTVDARLHPASSIARIPAPASLDLSPSFTFGLHGQPTFKLDGEGWLRGLQGELIFWVLPEHRSNIWWPGMSALLGAHAVRLDLSRCQLGEGWTQCFTP